MKNIKKIVKNVIHKNTTNKDNATSVGASIARPSSKASLHTKTILIIFPIIILLIVTLMAIGITNAANNATEPETDQTFTEDGDGYYIWVRAVDHAGNKGPWSEAQRVWIETGAPTITIKTNSNTTWAQTGSVTVALQDSKSGLASGASVKYGWSESLDTEPSSYEVASLNYTAGTKEEVTFTASASGLTGKYYLWVVPTTLADTAGNTQTTTAKSTGQFYFDNEKPNLSVVPKVNGVEYNGDWTAGPIKPVLTFSDDNSGIDADSLQWKLKDGEWSYSENTSTTTFTGNWSANQDTTGYYRIYDNAGNYEEVSFAVKIDTNNPKVSAKNSSVTITKGQNYAMSTYFTTDKNGSAGISSTTYKIGSTSYTNTSSLAVGTYTVTCTVTKVTGKTASASMTLVVEKAGVSAAEIAANPATYYGKTVTNYTCTSSAGVNAWKIFYADSSYIYLITDDYIHYNYVPKGKNGNSTTKVGDYSFHFTGAISDYTGSSNITDTRIRNWIKWRENYSSATTLGIRATAFLLDKDVWGAKFANSTYAEYAIGSPTYDLYMASYNQTFPSSKMSYTLNGSGYVWSPSSLSTSNGLYVITSTNKAQTLWLAAPSGKDTGYSRALVCIASTGSVTHYNYYCDWSKVGCRPVVCLKSTVKLQEQANGTFMIKL